MEDLIGPLIGILIVIGLVFGLIIAVFIGIVWLLLISIYCLDMVLGGLTFMSPHMSWLVVGTIAGSISYFAVIEAQKLRRPGVSVMLLFILFVMLGLLPYLSKKQFGTMNGMSETRLVTLGESIKISKTGGADVSRQLRPIQTPKHPQLPQLPQLPQPSTLSPNVTTTHQKTIPLPKINTYAFKSNIDPSSTLDTQCNNVYQIKDQKDNSRTAYRGQLIEDQKSQLSVKQEICLFDAILKRTANTQSIDIDEIRTEYLRMTGHNLSILEIHSMLKRESDRRSTLQGQSSSSVMISGRSGVLQ